MVESADLKNFFDEKMTGDAKHLKELTKEGFNCFKTVFLAINSEYLKPPTPESESQTT